MKIEDEPTGHELRRSTPAIDMPSHSYATARRDLLASVGAISAGLLGATVVGSPAVASTGGGGERTVRLDDAASVTAQRLDAAVAKAFPLFDKPSILPEFDATRHGARHDVELRRIVTTTTVPETGEVLEITGLLALPRGAAGSLPVVSWQHGTILSFDQVPSNLTRLADPDYQLSDEADSLETLFNLHRFAAQGFVVIAADYVGKGPLRNGRGEGYAVKGVTTATCIDMLDAGLSALPGLGVTPAGLYLHGWSQGALNTQWLHQALRGRGVAIEATAVASPFNDLVESWHYWTGRQTFPLPDGTTTYPDLPAWISLCLIICLGSYELHYGLDGLIESAVRPEFRAMARKYWGDYRLDFDSSQPFPTGSDLLVPAFFDRFTDERNSALLRQLAANGASYWKYDSPIRFYFGLADEAIHPRMVERALSAGGRLAQGIPVAGASHRATFLAGLYGDGTSLAGSDDVLAWFRSRS